MQKVFCGYLSSFAFSLFGFAADRSSSLPETKISQGDDVHRGKYAKTISLWTLDSGQTMARLIFGQIDTVTVNNSTVIRSVDEILLRDNTLVKFCTSGVILNKVIPIKIFGSGSAEDAFDKEIIRAVRMNYPDQDAIKKALAQFK